MNQQLINDVAKAVRNTEINQSLSPGSVGRRYEPKEGIKAHNERIHRESKFADDHKKLPFTFKKPSTSKGRSALVACDNCGNVTSGTTATVGIVCRACGKFSKVHEVE